DGDCEGGGEECAGDGVGGLLLKEKLGGGGDGDGKSGRIESGEEIEGVGSGEDVVSGGDEDGVVEGCDAVDCVDGVSAVEGSGPSGNGESDGGVVMDDGAVGILDLDDDGSGDGLSGGGVSGLGGEDELGGGRADGDGIGSDAGSAGGDI